MLTSRHIIHQRLEHTATLWRRLQWLQATAWLGATACGAILLIGLAARFGLISDLLVARVLAGFLAVVFLLAWAGLSLIISIRPLERRLVAAAVEEGYDGLADRVNTLVHLEQTLPPARLNSMIRSAPDAVATADKVHREETLREYQERIRAQAAVVLEKHPGRSPFRWVDLVPSLVGFLLLFLCTWQFYRHVHPWDYLKSHRPSEELAVAKDPPPLEIPPPEQQVVEKTEPWGEVRITEPAADLRITRLDTVPMQIEAAASDTIEKVEWFSARNGGQETAHTLPPPTDPNYAAYQEELRATDAQLEDWDVLTYYAQAKTRDGKIYQSDVHFLEVMPLRAELENLPGGSEGTTYRTLAELTALIERQQEVVRQAYRQSRTTTADAPESRASREELAHDESQLEAATRHLSAESRNELPAEVAQPFSERLADAEKSLDEAEHSLQTSPLPDAQERTRDALGKLTAARRFFQEALSQQPNQLAEQDATTPRDLGEKIEEIREYQDAQKVAQNTLSELGRQERRIQQQAATQSPADQSALAKEQDQINLQLEQLLQERPEWMQTMPQACESARGACRQASQALRGNSPQSSQAASAAADQIDKLAQTLRERDATQQLSQAYDLKQALERQIGQLKQVEKNPEAFEPKEMQQQAQETENLVREMKRLAEEMPTRDQFEPPLREALTDQAVQDLKSKCQGMCQKGSSGERGEAASGVRQGLEQIAKAFEASQPQGLSRAGKNNTLQPQGEDALARGLRELESLAREAGRQGREGDDTEQPAEKASDPSRLAGKPVGPPAANADQPTANADQPETKASQPQGKDGQVASKQAGEPKSPGEQPGKSEAPDAQRPGRLTGMQRDQLRQDALTNLREGIYGRYGHNERSEQAVGQLEKQLNDSQTPIDASVVEQMLRTIQNIQRERRAVADRESPQEPDVIHVDPAKLPPTYRRPIESYFRRLSEQR